jgi:hypothetical protein
MYPPGPVGADGRPVPSPAGAPAGPSPKPDVKPYLASVPSPADAPKPRGLKKFFSFLWHGGSRPEDENKPTVYDYSTGRTDLMNARPWMKPASSK